MPGTLYVVATPLGNLEDISFRALRILGEVALIAAEDTRHSRKLLEHYHIRTPLISYHDRVERQKAPRLVERIAGGDSIALIADAGTPCISDPGYRLVCAAAAAGLRVTPVPGPCAVAAVLSVSALPTDRFAFEGFVPARPAARRAFYEGLRREARTVVCFETARRLTASLQDLAAVLGERDVVVAREVTKLHEEFLRGRAADVASRSRHRTWRGEVTLLIGAAPQAVPERTPEDMRAALRRLRAEGLGLKRAARLLAAESGWSARDLYRLGLENEAGPR
jgi:16S rRNA (cytidine1402-2'-O)-methyltransferase